MAISDTLPWSERLALSIMKRHPEAWQAEDEIKKEWDYKTGLLLTAFGNLYAHTNQKVYYDYIKTFADTLIDASGNIRDYKIEYYNLDLINSGKILFGLYKSTKDDRYLTALKTLRSQLKTHPRTPSGGFWHKKIYPNQMWLDGLYMGAPFYAQYNTSFEKGDKLDDIAFQFKLIWDHTYDDKTGLLYHAWDESKQMDWADKTTGKSPNFWSRSMGWYMMALVDVLDYFPQDHPKRDMLISHLNQLSKTLTKYQDETGLWYQVTNMPERDGNYLEASGSGMFIYAFAKGVDKEYLPAEYNAAAEKGFKGMVDHLVEVDKDGEVHITQICKSAGLGGNPYRDGSFEYYINEPIVTDNLHGTGPFILAALALNQ
ncbi:glycoside hydrolase family 105 protein [Maribacter sp. LLG6340-A2]|uniref:glycoside hydrolase family 88/105 protein n=1 Tax=Maribacter sp. LLG6340-A2 TaxID=3160834 RepID=UPI0038665B83